MKRNRKAKILLYIVFSVVLLAGIIASNILWKNSQVSCVRVEVSYGDNATILRQQQSKKKKKKDAKELLIATDTLVRANTIKQLVVRKRPMLLSIKVGDVDVDDIRKLVLTNPYVEHAEVSVSIRSEVIIRVTQRRPVIHIFVNNRDFYIDNNGIVLPLSEEGYANVIIGNGTLKEHFKKGYANTNFKSLSRNPKYKHLASVKLWQLAEFFFENPSYGVLFDQIYIDDKKDLYVVPKVGNHIVLVGDAQHFDSKFSDLLTFYKKGMKQVGWNTYKQISLKYEGQVICTSR